MFLVLKPGDFDGNGRKDVAYLTEDRYMRILLFAEQPGNDVFDAAPHKTLTFCINPPKPTVTSETFSDPYEIRLTSSSETNNQWYVNGTAVTGETNQVYVISQSGLFQVKVDYDGCNTFSDPIDQLYLAAEGPLDHAIDLYPVPARDHLIVETSLRVISLGVNDAIGKAIPINQSQFSQSRMIDVSSLKPGVYLIDLKTDRGIVRKKFVKK